MSMVEKTHLTLVGDALSVAHNRIEFIRRRLVEGYERLDKELDGWVEGSLQIAMALRDGRTDWPGNIGFSKWLKANNLDRFGKDERWALVKLADDPDLAREVLAKA